MNDLIVYSHEDEEIISDSEGSEYGESSTIGTTMEEELSSELSSFSNDPAIAEVLNKNVNLADYSTVLEEQLAESEKICVEAYAGKSKSLAKLQTNIDDCDNILAGMQEMLLGFQADLSGISDEIKHLQEESMTMGVKLRNRRSAEHGVRGFLSNVVISPSLAATICNGAISTTYLAYVIELNEKHKYVSSREPPKDGTSSDIAPLDTVAGKEMRSHIEKLRLKAVEKSREYFINVISELRRAKTNVRMIQTTKLLKYKQLIKFLDDAAPDVHQEVRNIYAESMTKTIFSLFKTYQQQLAKLDSKIAGKHDLICVDEKAVKDMFSTKINMSKRSDPFSLGDRGRVLDIKEEKPIMVHIATAEKEKYPYEMLFRSVMKHLMDAATNEYAFTKQFFADNSREIFHQIYTKTLSLILENLENFLYNCHDAVCLLLMIRLTESNRKTMKQRNANVLDNFFDRINMLLWPRLKTIFDNNLKSLKTATPKKLGSVELHPHYISRRYAEFTSSMLTLLKAMDDGVGKKGGEVDTEASTRFGGKEMLRTDLMNLQNAMLKLLTQLSGQHSTNKNKIVFLINNLDSIVCVLQERKVDREEVAKYEERLNQQREQFVEEELRQSYSKLIAFVIQTEGIQKTDKKLELDLAVCESLVRIFSTTWKNGIEQINNNVLSYFSNFRNGMEILKQVLTQLLLYYTRFQGILKKSFKKAPPFAKELVSTNAILAEIKKYALAI